MLPRHPRRTTAALVLLGLTAACAGPIAPVLAPAAVPVEDSRAPAAPVDPVPGTVPKTAPVVPITYPKAGPQEWDLARGKSAVVGAAGPVRQYRVAVEDGIQGVTASDFADTVEGILGHRRSWAATGKTRLQRVGTRSDPDFTVYLATPATRDQLCGDAAAGEIDRYTSCRNGDSVVINVERWVRGVPRYGASLATYRTYMINHEVGHALGFGHEKCPREGSLAPVMQQQTLGLHGCRANGWPSRKNGTAYHGPPGAYGDRVPSPS